MAALSAPPPTQPVTEAKSGQVTEPWYRFLIEISRLRTDLDALSRLTKNMGAVDISWSGTATFVGST